MKTILLLDDNEDAVVLQTIILESDGFSVQSAINGVQGLEKLKTFHPDIIVSDVLMPEMDGFEFCRAVKRDDNLKNIPVVFYSAQYTDEEDKELADDVGAEGFIYKPIEMETFLTIINRILEQSKKRHSRSDEVKNSTPFEQKHYEAQAKMLDKKLHELEEQHAKVRKGLVDMIKAVGLTIEKRDPYTAGHQQRVSEIAANIARELGWDEARIEGVKLGALVHDIGKLAVPIEILSKPGKLLPIEFELIKMHPQEGYEILKDIDFPWPIAQMILQHHERINGSGYPQGLRDNQILDEAKILGVADVVEAIASHRPYRPALGIDVAISEIEKYKGELYDPFIVDMCVKVLRENKDLLKDH
ncbi:MAG: response regulator [Campylobacterales bacterium]|nr:response regulator [Campylobacterales bacterium]